VVQQVLLQLQQPVVDARRHGLDGLIEAPPEG
jgi:hypothetical protein